MIGYLAGGINGLTDDQATTWRERMKELSPEVEWLDPMRRDYRGREDESVNEIVLGDYVDIDSSDFVIANCVRPSWGTGMEIHYAFMVKPAVAIVSAGQPVSPWLRYHTTLVVNTLEEAAEWVRSL